MFCFNCGKEIQNDMSFCPHCGTQLNNSSSSSSHQQNSSNDYESGYISIDDGKPFDYLNFKESIEFECYYMLQVENEINGIPGIIEISPFGAIFSNKVTSVMGFLGKLGALGQKIEVKLPFEDFLMYDIDKNGWLWIYLGNKLNYEYFIFQGATFKGSKNNRALQNILYTLECYRRLYWYSGKYSETTHLCLIKEVLSASNSNIDVNNISTADLVRHVNNINH